MAFNPNEHMMNLKGKDYLQVAWRLVWFREEHPDWSLDTVPLTIDADHAVFKAVICDEAGVQKSAGHGSESKRDFGDFIEKAETKAVGRALAMLGYGTQFAADELDEGARIVDSPVKRGKDDTPQSKEEDQAELAKTRARTAAKEQPTNEQPAKQLATDEQKKKLYDAANDAQRAACDKMYGEHWASMTAAQCATMLRKIEKGVA